MLECTNYNQTFFEKKHLLCLQLKIQETEERMFVQKNILILGCICCSIAHTTNCISISIFTTSLLKYSPNIVYFQLYMQKIRYQVYHMRLYQESGLVKKESSRQLCKQDYGILQLKICVPIVLHPRYSSSISQPFVWRQDLATKVPHTLQK